MNNKITIGLLLLGLSLLGCLTSPKSEVVASSVPTPGLFHGITYSDNKCLAFVDCRVYDGTETSLGCVNRAEAELKPKGFSLFQAIYDGRTGSISPNIQFSTLIYEKDILSCG